MKALFLKFQEKMRAHPSLSALLLPAGVALGLNLLIEIMGHRSLIAAIGAILAQPVLFLLNTIIILSTLTLSGLFKHRGFVLTVLSTLWLGLGITNCVLMHIRNSPLCGEDFHILTTGFSIITVYLTLFQIIIIAISILLALGGLVVLYRKLPKSSVPLLPALIQVLGTTTILAVLTVSVQASGEVPDQFDSMAEAYEQYGFVYCFTQTVFDRGIDEPKDYSEQNVEAILTLLDEKRPASKAEKPNVVIVQLESFFDLNAVTSITLSENPIPYFTHLKQTCPSGFLTVPNVGGGTANTEFEILSGMSLDYFGIGEYPYNTVLQEQTIPSYAFLLKELGYSTHVFHNHEGSFYDRNHVYPNLGFDNFTSIEYMNGYDRNSLGWCDDSILTEELISSMQETPSSDFLFAVSVQCHGKYPTEYESPANGIHVEGVSSPALNAQFRYYADQIREVDNFLRELTAALSSLKEPVLLVLYGDHLPSLNLTEEDLVQHQSLYQTEYVIWSNTEDLEPVREDLVCYQLGAYALQYAGIHDGALTTLHNTMRDKDCYQSWLHTLQYDMVYGPNQTLKEPYQPTEMTMGHSTIRVINAWNTKDGVYVFGTNFTAHSVVQINGWSMETEFLSNSLLLATNASVAHDDAITVAQVSDSKTELSRTEPLLYEHDLVDE